jgi:hypothetical protein
MGLGLFYTGLGAGTRHSGHSSRYQNGINNYGLATSTTVASNSGEVPHMAAVAKSANAASPSLKQSKEGVERVEEGAGVPLMEGIGSRRDDNGARA